MSPLAARRWESWNPVTGCTHVSAGCAHCYAERFAERWRGLSGHHYEHGFELTLRPERLELPLRWRTPRHVFVTSMGDLFHEEVPDEYVAAVFAVMARAERHLFHVLTKRHERLRTLAGELPWPANVHLGVTVEHMATASRLDVLRAVPAALRHVSAEPLLGPLDELDLAGIDWLIAGGESGPSRRPVRVEWLRGLRDHCLEAGVAFTFKGWGGGVQGALGRTLDGREWDERPAAVREVTAADGEGERQATLWDVSSAGSGPARRLPSPSVSTS